MKTLKNWWLQIITIVALILDLGFEVINPLLLEIGISEKTANLIKISFTIYALLKSKLQNPTQNAERLQAKVDAFVSAKDIGSPRPPRRPKKD